MFSTSTSCLPSSELMSWLVTHGHDASLVCIVAQSCPTLCDPMACSPPGSSVHGDSPDQEFWSGLPCPPPGDLPQPRDQTQVSCVAGGFCPVCNLLSVTYQGSPLPECLMAPGFNPGHHVAFHCRVSTSSNLSVVSQSFLTL